MALRDIPAALTRTRVEQRSDATASLAAGLGSVMSSQATVGYDQAQAHGAVYACVDLLVRKVGWQMPVLLGDSPATAEIVTDPHPEPHMLAGHWRAQVIEPAALRGFAAGVVTSMGPNGWPRKILPVHPDLVTWWDDRGTWRWHCDGTAMRLWQEGGELWVAPSMRPAPGSPVGRSVISHAAAKIRLGLSATKFGRDYFDAKGLPVSHLKHAEKELTATQAQTAKDRFRRVVENREPLVTGSDWTLDTLPVSAEDSQFLETIQANVADVCRFFGVPPEAIGGSSGDSTTYANVEGRELSLLTNTIGSWMTWFEQVLSALLPGQTQLTLDPEAMLRTSVPTLFDTAQKAVGRGNTPGVLTANEARAMVGYGPVPNGDDLYVPVNYSPAAVIEDVVTNGGGGGGQPAANP